MTASEQFKFETIIKGGAKTVMLKGVIDEDSDFTPLAKLGDGLTFNFKNIEAINSLGIRAWVNFVKTMAGKDIVFEECPPIIVKQMNMIPSFCAGAEVRSVYVPYVCSECDSETRVLVTHDQFAEVAETMPCEECTEGEMEFDGQPERYFAFMK